MLAPRFDLRRPLLAFGAALLGVATGGAFLGCSDDPDPPAAGEDAGGPDAAPPPSDAGPSTDAADDTPSCEVYCAEVASNCRGEIPSAGMPDVPTFQYPSQAGCLHACSKLSPGTAGDTTGDTVGCRTYHAGTPAATEPRIHCPHAGLVGAGMCSGAPNTPSTGRCQTFCKLAVALCTSEPKPFANEADCMTACAAFEFAADQNELTKSGDTLNCRQFHLIAAYNDPPLPDGGPANSAVASCPNLGAASPACQ